MTTHENGRKRQKRGQKGLSPKQVTPDIIDKILALHEEGMTLKAACAFFNLPRTTVWDWLQKHAPERYARAREASAHAMVDSIFEEISKETDPVVANLLRLKMDMVKWTASKVDPKNFGEKIQNEISGPDGEPIKAGIIAIPAPYATIEEWKKAVNPPDPLSIDGESSP